MRETKQWKPQYNIGNQLLEHIRSNARNDESFKKQAKLTGEVIALEEYLFDAGTQDLNRLLAKNCKEAGGRNPRRRP